MKHILIAALLACSAQATPTFSDSFDAPLGANWETYLPYEYSSVTQENGSVTINGRAMLATTTDFPTPYLISGTFTMLNDYEHFHVAFRSDMSTPGEPFYERSGLYLTFANDGDGISFQRYISPDDWSTIAVTPFDLITGQSYAFGLFDDGYNVSLDLDGQRILEGASSFSTGQRIGFYSREFGDAATRLDDVMIEDASPLGRAAKVSDTGSTLLMLIPLAGLLLVRRR